jgi:predicted metalloprotease
VLFRDATETGCGAGQTAMGPFYCPNDEKVYIDLAFYEELKDKFQAAGDFAQAYVIAHELGHHVQHLLGTDAAMNRAIQGGENRNTESVKLELQADCYAGVWAHSTEQRKLLEAGDVDEALNAAASVGDDRIQQRTTGSVHPESFTHGTAAQRSSWFKRGLQTGDPGACDTFR